ncbi:MAG: S8 family serine peptidase, partial [Streptococcaceae bacterium]|nr:S8 family serine peptidase [Streptococcaceae bacterium]
MKKGKGLLIKRHLFYIGALFSLFLIVNVAPQQVKATIYWDDEADNQLEVNDTLHKTGGIHASSSKGEKQSFIVVYKEKSERTTAKIEAITHTEASDEYDTVLNGIATEATVEEIMAVEALPEVSYVTYDHQIQALDTRGNSLAGISAYRSLVGGDKGAGLVIAVIDTGVDLSHYAFSVAPPSPRLNATSYKLAGVDHGKYINSKIPYSYSYVTSSGEQEAAHYHGTHVAGIAASRSYAIDYYGVSYNIEGAAPDAQIVNMQVFEPTTNSTTSESVVIKAIDDAVKLKVDVINLSLGSPKARSIAFNQVIKDAKDKGIMVVAAAGNYESANKIDQSPVSFDLDLKDQWTISTPSTAPEAISVAASTLGNQLSGYSSWGGDTTILDFKPEVTAYGGSGYSLPDFVIGPVPSGSALSFMSGTSMATPLVSAGAALVKKALSTKYSGVTLADQVDIALVNTAKPLFESGSKPYSPRKQGAGLMQVQNAVKNKVVITDVTTNDDTLSDGILELKKITSRLITRQLKLINTSNTDVSYEWNDLGVYQNDVVKANVTLTDKLINYSNIFIKNGSVNIAKDSGIITVPKNSTVTLTV